MTSFIASSHIHHKYIILNSVNISWHTPDFQINTFTHQTWYHSSHTFSKGFAYKLQRFRSLPFREYFYRVGGSSGRGNSVVFGITSLPSAFEHSSKTPSQFLICRLGLDRLFSSLFSCIYTHPHIPSNA